MRCLTYTGVFPQDERDCSRSKSISIPKLAAQVYDIQPTVYCMGMVPVTFDLQAVHIEKEIQKKIADKLEQRLNTEVSAKEENAVLQKAVQSEIDSDIDRKVQKKLRQQVSIALWSVQQCHVVGGGIEGEREGSRGRQGGRERERERGGGETFNNRSCVYCTL